MKLNLIITWILFFWQISTLILAFTQICQHLVINKSNKCKEKFFSFEREKNSWCVCRNMNVKMTLSNKTQQTLANLKDPHILYSICTSKTASLVF